jgi:predicted thioesterase
MLDQVLRRAGDVFDRHVRVNPVLIKRVDDIDLEPLKRALDSQLKALRSAVQARSTLHPTGIEVRIKVGLTSRNGKNAELGILSVS